MSRRGDEIAAAIEAATGHRLRTIDIPVAGTSRVSDGAHTFFLKTGPTQNAAAYAAEAAGLEAITATGTVRVPAVIAHGSTGRSAWLMLEWLDLHARSETADAELGRALAHMHRHQASQYGWHRDNTIGPTRQQNNRHADWASFWRDERLAPQLRLALHNGHVGRVQALGEQLLNRVGDLLRGHAPAPSLLHGDLWSGNAGALADGTPVTYDACVYYGDREADVAMTELFGGFSGSFHAAYREAWPLDDGYAGRRDLYNLYHVLNHLNLFGTGYLAQAERLMQRLLTH